MPLARISLTLSRHFSLSFIASGKSSGLYLVSSHSCWMYVRAGPPAFARPYVGVHRNTSLMSSSLLLQLCSACLVCQTWIVSIKNVDPLLLHRGRIVGALWGAAGRTCSILLAAFLCNCRLSKNVNCRRIVLLVSDLPTPWQLCTNELCHSLLVDLSNTEWSKRWLRNKLSGNASGAGYQDKTNYYYYIWFHKCYRASTV